MTQTRMRQSKQWPKVENCLSGDLWEHYDDRIIFQDSNIELSLDDLIAMKTEIERWKRENEPSKN